jgi:hypothetical protein
VHPEARQDFLRPYPALDGLCRWDCGWFLRIMDEGFSQIENAKVFPLYSALSWSLSRVTGWHRTISLLVVANTASFASYLVIHGLFRKLESAAAARWGLMLFASYPFAYYQAAAYSEPLMILGSSAALLLAYRGSHLWAGTALGLGLMARHVTVFFGLGLLAAQVLQRGIRPKRLLWNVNFLGLTIPFAFLAAWSWYLRRKVGDPLAYWHAREINFGPSVFWSVREVFKNVSYDSRPELYFYIFFTIIPLVGTLWLFAKKETVPLGMAAAGLMAAAYYGGGIGLGRYTSACWPAFLPLGAILSRRPVLQGPVVGGLMLVQGIFFWLFSHQWPLL